MNTLKYTARYSKKFDLWFDKKEKNFKLWLIECKARFYKAVRALTTPTEIKFITMGNIIHYQLERGVDCGQDRIELDIKILLCEAGVNYFNKVYDMEGRAELYGHGLYYDPNQDKGGWK